jgi:hypothetical protein
MTQEELEQLKALLEKAHLILNLSDAYTDISVKSEDGELVLVGDNLWVQNAYGKSRTVSSKGIVDKEFMVY